MSHVLADGIGARGAGQAGGCGSGPVAATFFDLGDGQVKDNKKIDTKLSSVLFTLPVPAIAPHTQTSPTVLPQRNLLRQLTWVLPSGQQVAKAMGVPPLKPGDLTASATYTCRS